MTDDGKSAMAKALLEERAELKTRLLIADVIASGLASEDAFKSVLSAALEEMDTVRGAGKANLFLAGLLGGSLAQSWSNAHSDEEREAVDDHAGYVMTALVGAALPIGRPTGGIVKRLQHMVFAIVGMNGGGAAQVAWAEYAREIAAKLRDAEQATRQ